MFLEVALWLPLKVVKHFLKPVTTTFDTFAEMSNQAIDDYIKENPL